MLNTLYLKTCKYCGETKPRELFPANPLMNDLRESKCKKCRAAYDRDKRAKRISGNKISHF
jgi:predicted nucleic-acid-binding Zn-ribbon protein